MRIVNGKDFWAGLMFVGFGLSFVLWSQNYPMGSALRMGPAYFPTTLGGLMAVLGALVFARSFFSKIEAPIKQLPLRIWLLAAALVLTVPMYNFAEWFGDSELARWLLGALTLGLFLGAWGDRSLFVILISVAAFGYTVRPLGLTAATIILVMGAAFAGHEFKFKEAAMLAGFMALFAVWAFVKGLGLSMNIWPYAWS